MVGKNPGQKSIEKEVVSKMKLKKLVSAVACVVMAGVLPPALSLPPMARWAAARQYLVDNKISYDISKDEVDLILKKFNNSKADAEAAGDALIAQVKADPNNAASIVTNTLAGYGVTVL